MKKRKIQNKGADSSVIILRHPRIKLDLTQPEIPGSEQPGVEQPKLGTITKVNQCILEYDSLLCIYLNHY